MLVVAGCATRSQFDTLYDHYFPMRSEYVTSQYRQSFDRDLFGAPPAVDARSRRAQLYGALRGDPAAFHAFVHHSDRDVDGHPGEEWIYECVLLLLRLGDSRFAALLAREDSATREKVGVAIDTQIDWTRHNFPQTRALYSYRYVRYPRNA